MKAYRERERTEFQRLLNNVLEIQKNLESNHYSTIPKNKLKILIGDDLNELWYYNNLPEDVKKEHQENNPFNLRDLQEELLKINKD